jgi:hypothetical protein
MNRHFEIHLTEGAENVGLAVILKDLIIQNLEQKPDKISDFNRISVDIGLIVPDAGIEIHLKFSKGTLTVCSGIRGRPDLIIVSDSEQVLALSNVKIKWGLPYYFDEQGKEVLNAMREKRIRVKGLFFHFPSLVRFSRIMSVR